eukprot:CAMPEP_0194127428 /NCGR_PEP_ID=MMETSP0150-20130528/60513_1 /TAXON_ID=122233 /ORGANISM="Chaetoceros debilis, Strain MM31A-1" /LENGTH=777 /DNA_ID=CAMNT_0038821349 /DNA_START=57 /DNA_END=2391 /DNA_ORIENTATION=-
MTSVDNLPPTSHVFKPTLVAIFGPGSAGCLSFLASLGIVVMVSRKTNGGLSSPYRRIIFGMSISDMISSFSFVIGPWAIPASTDNSFGIGNDATCRMDGFLLTMGSAAVPLYSCLLCFYYVCKLRFRMANENFEGRFEWKCHTIIFLYTVTVAVVAVGLNIIGANTDNAYCLCSSIPRGCMWHPEIVGECEDVARNRYVIHMFFLLLIIQPASCFIFICICMGMLYCYAISWERVISNELPDPKMSTSEHGQPKEAEGNLSHNSSSQNENLHDLSRAEMSQSSCQVLGCRCEYGDENNGEKSIEQKQEIFHDNTSDDPYKNTLRSKNKSTDHVQKLSQLFVGQTKTMLVSYISVFMLLYMPVTIGLITRLITGKFPSLLEILVYFYPLGGLFNIFIYTRPQVVNLRRINGGEMSRFHAFLLVLGAGGEAPALKVEENLQDQSAVDSMPGARFGEEYPQSTPFPLKSSAHDLQGFSLLSSDSILSPYESEEKMSHIEGGSSSRMVDIPRQVSSTGLRVDNVGSFHDNLPSQKEEDDGFRARIRDRTIPGWVVEDVGSMILNGTTPINRSGEEYSQSTPFPSNSANVMKGFSLSAHFESENKLSYIKGVSSSRMVDIPCQVSSTGLSVDNVGSCNDNLPSRKVEDDGFRARIIPGWVVEDFDSMVLNGHYSHQPFRGADFPSRMPESHIMSDSRLSHASSCDVRPAAYSSTSGINGLSESFGDSYAGSIIRKEDWTYLKGIDASMPAYSSNNSRESIKDITISILPASTNDQTVSGLSQ